MYFFRHTFQNFLYIIMETLLEGMKLGYAQAHPAHPVAPPMGRTDGKHVVQRLCASLIDYAGVRLSKNCGHQLAYCLFTGW
jgi:hypothetical protein